LGVRVKLRICGRSNCIETAALVNSGFESDEPEIILPPSLATVLNLQPSSSLASYVTVGGSSIAAVRGAEPLRVKLLLDDEEGPEVQAVPSVIPGEEEVIMSDRLAHELGIVIIDPYEGLWCLRNELGRKVRRSVSPEFWRG
jgi:predicted aspartyl protease